METLILTNLKKKTSQSVKMLQRQDAINSGHFMKPKHQVMKDKKAYTRKSKHKFLYND